MINEKQVLSIYENILSIKKKVNISIECKRIAKIFDCNPKKIWDIVTKEEIPVVSEEAFREEEHPRGGAKNKGQFTSKGGGGTTKTDDKKTKDKKTRIQTKTRRNTPKELTFGSDIVNKRNKIHDEVLKHYPNFNKEILLAEIEKSEKEYEYVDYVRKIQHNKIEQIASYMGIEDFNVTSRVKDTLSAVEKIARKSDKYKTIDDLDDRVGCRLVLNSNEDVFKFVQMAKANFIVTEAEDFVTDGHSDGSGYRSYHLIIQDPDSKFTSEVQIRTKNQNKWAEAFHLIYKPENSEMRNYKDEHQEELTAFGNGLSSYYFALDNGEEPPNPPEIPHALKVMGFDFETKLQEEDEKYREQYGKDFQPIKDLISSLGEAEVTTIFDLMVAEVEEMTPDEGFNVCLFDDFAPHGEMLTLVGNYPDEETAQQIVSKCEEQGEIAYIYPSKVLYTEDDIEEDVDVKDLAKDLLEAEGNQEEMVD